jgi:hypothetical protein
MALGYQHQDATMACQSVPRRESQGCVDFDLAVVFLQLAIDVSYNQTEISFFGYVIPNT